MGKHGPKHVVYSADFAFGFAILLRSMRTIEAKFNTIRLKEGMVIGIIKLASIITLKRFNGSFKLSCDIFLKMEKNIKDLRFVGEGKRP